MKFYFSPGACSFATQITLNEVGAKYEPIKVDMKNKPADFLKLNPKGYVPALMTDKNEFLTEGAAILQFVADAHPEKNLIPKFGTFDRYRAIEMLNYIATELHKNFSPLFRVDTLVKSADAKTELKESLKNNLYKKYEYIEEKLKTSGPFLMGAQFTVCDAYLYTVTNWTKHLGMDMTKFPKTMGFMEKVQSRPSVQAAQALEG